MYEITIPIQSGRSFSFFDLLSQYSIFLLVLLRSMDTEVGNLYLASKHFVLYLSGIWVNRPVAVTDCPFPPDAAEDPATKQRRFRDFDKAP